MAYVERDDQDLELNNQSDFFDDDLYDELYFAESFGERVDSGRDEDYAVLDEEEMIIKEHAMSRPDNRVEDGFGEAINSSSNPHIKDQLEDDHLKSEAEADYTNANNDKDGLNNEKLNDWTEKADQ